MLNSFVLKSSVSIKKCELPGFLFSESGVLRSYEARKKEVKGGWKEMKTLFHQVLLR
jgi:hypothetical protein